MASYSQQAGAVWLRRDNDGNITGGIMNILGIKMFLNANRKKNKEKQPEFYAVLADVKDEQHEIFKTYKEKYEYKKEGPITKNVDDEINEL